MAEILAINSDYKRTLLDSLELFKGVLPEDIQELLQSCDRRDLAVGEFACAQLFAQAFSRGVARIGCGPRPRVERIE